MEGIVVPFMFFGFVGFVVWTAISHHTRRATLRADLQKQLLERFSTGQELAAFLETEAGREFLSNSEDTRPRHRWLGMAQGAIVVIFLGVGFLATSSGDGYMLMPGTILLAIGLGLLAAAGLAWYVERKQRDDDRPDDQLTSHPIE